MKKKSNTSRFLPMMKSSKKKRQLANIFIFIILKNGINMYSKM